MPPYPSISIQTYDSATVTVQSITDKQAQREAAVKAFAKHAGDKAVEALRAHGLSSKAPVEVSAREVLTSIADTAPQGDDSKCAYRIEGWIVLKIG